MRNLQIFIFALCVAPIFSNNFVQYSTVIPHQQCNTPLGEIGACVSLKYCPQIVNLFTKLPQNSAKQYSTALRAICGHQITADNYPVICCSKVVITETRTQYDNMPQPRQQNNTALTDAITNITQSFQNSSKEQADKQTACLSPILESGYCVALENCTGLIDILKANTNSDKLKSYLRSSNSICGAAQTDVCCPHDIQIGRKLEESQPRTLPKEDDGCGLAKADFYKIVGGRNSEIGAWPWIALIGYDIPSPRQFKCGGTLITAKHVLTAAHCLRDDLTFVRLGEFDLASEDETNHIDINVAKKVRHPNYAAARRNDGRYDIAVLYLVKNAEFSEHVCPICLPISENLLSKSYVDSKPYVAGWGRTIEGGESSNVLQELQVQVFENAECRKSYAAKRGLFSEQQFDDSVICAGVLSGGKDTCQGDSGGPLMIPEAYKGINRYYLIGVVSYGIGCARVGVPGVYTSTRHFMDWITEMVAES